MSAPEFDPALVEQGARAICALTRTPPSQWRYWEREARAVLTAVAPTLRAEGETNLRRLASEKADAYDEGYQRGKVDGAREVFADLEAAIAEQRITLLNDGVRIATERIHAAAREAVARIEKED